VRRCAEASAGSVAQVYKSLGCSPQCGKCVPLVRDLLHDVRGRSHCSEETG
jgi:bacterioferritin-associated ferredoxin